ncbi:MAG: hypothetical protein ACI8WB_001480 [Phenylobacterium sp.]|jgi:hypothetical protein
MRSIASSSLAVTFTTLSKWFCIAWIGLSLQGCLSTAQPAYPTELQMIIAQSAANTTNNLNAAVKTKAPGAISVTQLMQSLHQRQTDGVKETASTNTITNTNTVTNANAKTNTNHSGWWNDSKPTAVVTSQWVASPAKQSTKPSTKQAVKQSSLSPQLNPQQRQLHLQYAPGQALPHLAQLLKLRQLTTTPNLTLISLSMGASSGQDAFNSAINAQKRIASLLNILNHPNVQPQYQPQLGDDQVIATFKLTPPMAASKEQS